MKIHKNYPKNKTLIRLLSQTDDFLMESRAAEIKARENIEKTMRLIEAEISDK